MRSKSGEYFQLIENYINEYKEKTGSSPTVREIESGIGLSKATVSRYLSCMRDNGQISYVGHRNITTKEGRKTQDETVKVPVLGAVSCGIPKYAEENIEKYVRLPVALFGRGQFFILRANGDSMIDANIHNGDLILVRQQNYADEGQIVVALVGDEATLKRFYPEPANYRIRLHPENKDMSDIYVSDCTIQGVAIRTIKNLE